MDIWLEHESIDQSIRPERTAPINYNKQHIMYKLPKNKSIVEMCHTGNLCWDVQCSVVQWPMTILAE